MRKLLFLLLPALILASFGYLQTKPKPKTTQQAGNKDAVHKKSASKAPIGKKGTTAISKMPQIRYFKGSLTELEDSARRSGMRYFIFIYAEQHAASRKFKDKIMSDTSLVRIIDSIEIIPYKMNSYDEAYTVANFGLDDIPTILVFESGTEIKRLTGFHDLDDVKRFFRESAK